MLEFGTDKYLNMPACINSRFCFTPQIVIPNKQLSDKICWSFVSKKKICYVFHCCLLKTRGWAERSCGIRAKQLLPATKQQNRLSTIPHKQGYSRILISMIIFNFQIGEELFTQLTSTFFFTTFECSFFWRSNKLHNYHMADYTYVFAVQMISKQIVLVWIGKFIVLLHLLTYHRVPGDWWVLIPIGYNWLQLNIF